MSGSKAQDEIKVPEGWILDRDGYGPGFDVVSMPDRFYSATIDWRGRCFRSGVSSYGQSIPSGVYKGSGWRQRLVDDAVKWLQKLRARA